jgi:flagellar motor switch protein FliN/FliY
MPEKLDQKMKTNNDTISGAIESTNGNSSVLSTDKVEYNNEETKYHTKDELDFLLDIPLVISVELGRTKMLINELLKLGQGSVIELTKSSGETLEILANQKLIAKGEVVSINDKYGIRLTEIISPQERIENLK